MKRHQVLGNNLQLSVEKCLAIIDKNANDSRELIKAGTSPQHIARDLRVSNSLLRPVFEHLGYGPIEGIQIRLDEGMDAAVEYFCGDWWRNNEIDAKALDKSRPDRDLRWFRVLPDAMLIGGLTGRWDDLAKICNWFDVTIELEYQGGLIEDQYMQLFLCIASSLRPDPIPGIESLLENVKSCRAKRPKLLCNLWEAALAKDQKAFDKALKDAVTHFLKVDASDVSNPVFWIAQHFSFLWLLAERNSLQFPDLPEKLEAAVIRRQTIGLA